MTHASTRFALAGLLAAAALGPLPAAAAKDIARPEEIKSKRLVVYDDATYAKLAGLWKDYDDAYPSEYAYANWMYAARYAGDPQYGQLLDAGLKKYPVNPTLLYLKSLEKHGAEDSAKERALLERAVALDSSAMDPWFSLVTVYMASGDTDRLDIALRRILTSGIVSDAVMDYNYNVLAGLEPNAILVTNGDNDTYPGWILTRILNVRPDVAIVNRSLLNTEWYPLRLIETGVPRFTDARTLEEMRKSVLDEMKAKKAAAPPGGLVGDALILQIVASAQRAGRPVYCAKTLYRTDRLAGLLEKGRDFGLVTLVTPSPTSYAAQMKAVYGTWVGSFRTGGLDGWRLRQAPETDAGRLLMANYAAGILTNLDVLRQHAPELRAGLFRWYTQHVEAALPADFKGHAAPVWCEHSDVAEIAAWCKQQGLGK